jgi:hypothetical protein
MNKFLYFVSIVRRSFIEMCGYEYSFITAAQAVAVDETRTEPRAFFEFGCSNNESNDQQLWGFGRHLLFSRR